MWNVICDVSGCCALSLAIVLTSCRRGRMQGSGPGHGQLETCVYASLEPDLLLTILSGLVQRGVRCVRCSEAGVVDDGATFARRGRVHSSQVTSVLERCFFNMSFLTC